MMKNVFLALFATIMFASCGGQQPETKAPVVEKKDLALQLYSVRDDIKKDYAGTIKKVGEMGFKAVEAAGYADGKFYGRTPAEFKADVEAAGMVALSSHTRRPLTDEEVAKKDFTAGLKWWNECLDASKAAGMTYVVDPWMEVPKSLDILKVWCDYYNAIGKLAKEKGMKFGYHNHNHEFVKVEDKVVYDFMLENTNPEYVFFEMDVYWVMRGAASPVDYFKKYPNRFKLLHIKDEKELGESGMVGFDAILKEKNTDKAGVEYLVIEVERYDYAPFESVKMSYDYLQKQPYIKASYSK